jgi:hypothetical protein
MGHVSKTWDTHDDLVVEPQNHPALQTMGFDRVWASKLGSAVPVRIEGGTWCHHRGCVNEKLLCEELMAVGLKSKELVHFAPSEVDRLYVHKGSLV